MSSANECLLDGVNHSPTIHIKTEFNIRSSNNKSWARFVYWVQKNMTLSIGFLIALLLTVYVFKSPDNSGVYQYYSSHQDKLRANHDFMEPDTILSHNNNYTIKGAFVVNAIEEDLYKLHYTMMDIERHFNQGAKYPWVIIGHKAFSKHFRQWISSITRAPVSFGLAPSIEWQEPYWIDIKRAEENIKYMAVKDLSRGESMHWRRMTRYNAGFIAYHPLLKDVEHIWKVQPGSRYHCDIKEDPFEAMSRGGYKLSFTVTKTENHEFIQGLDQTVKDFIRKHKDMIVPVKNSIYRALLNDDSKSHIEELIQNDTTGLGQHVGHYSNCMIYNNFMLVSTKFLKSKEYNQFFDYLDASGGFFYQRWGDAMPQTFAAALLLQKKDILLNMDVTGYEYDYGMTCPSNVQQYVDLKCTCSPSDYRIKHWDICTPKFQKELEL